MVNQQRSSGITFQVPNSLQPNRRLRLDPINGYAQPPFLVNGIDRRHRINASIGMTGAQHAMVMGMQPREGRCFRKFHFAIVVQMLITPNDQSMTTANTVVHVKKGLFP
jgi:hypothetical protein